MSNGYENAPATKMLATHCACCARPLVDAKSVEAGVGPDCRKKFGYDLDVPEAARIEANKVVYGIACVQEGTVVIEGCAKLRGLGFTVLAERIESRLAVVEIEEANGVLTVVTPYDTKFVDAIRQIPGRKWNKEKKVNTCPVAAKQALWAVLKSCFPNKVGRSAKGAFIIKPVEAPKPEAPAPAPAAQPTTGGVA
jgi:hypothetical protein